MQNKNKKHKVLFPFSFCFTLFVLSFMLACDQPQESPEERMQRLGDQLRCPVCRGVPISESPAELAQEMMGNLKEQINQGKSDEEILAFFEARYGEWVLLAPKAEGINLAVWILPIVLLLGGALFIIDRVKRKKI